jgi:DNA-binding response OmpR family regulator
VLCVRRPRAPCVSWSERPAAERSAAPHVLLVEDDEEIREELAEVLREDGYDVDAVPDATVASHNMKSSAPPDLILLDLRMPGVDGWQLRDAQLEDPRLAAVPVCLLSAEGDVKQTAEELGVAAWVSKPFALPALLETVRGLVRRA